jgi:hypothetical protein
VDEVTYFFGPRSIAEEAELRLWERATQPS